MPVTAGHWGHLVVRPESGSRATKMPDRDPRSTQRLSQLSWNRRHLVGDWGQSWNVTVSKPGSSKLTQGQTHTQLSASLRQVILVFTVFPCIKKKKKSFCKKSFPFIAVGGNFRGAREAYESSSAAPCLLRRVCCATRARRGRGRESPVVGVTCSEPGPGRGRDRDAGA